MKPFLVISSLLILTACDLTTLPQADCSEGYVLHTSPAGTERCIKPAMGMGDGVIDSAIILGVGVAAANSGVFVAP